MVCSACVSGTLKTDIPKGTVSKIHNLKTYIAIPETAPKGLIVIIPDTFGWSMPNNRLLADRYARDGGYLVYLPDFMNGNAVPSSMLSIMDTLMTPASDRASKSLISWAKTLILAPFRLIHAAICFFPFLYYVRHDTSYTRVVSFFHALRESSETKDMKIFVSGFCWGGRYTVLLAGNPYVAESRKSVKSSSTIDSRDGESSHETTLIDAAFTAHPSGIVLPDEVQVVKSPLSVIIGDTDTMMDLTQVLQMKEVLEKKAEVEHEVIVVPGARHGFALRGDESSERERVLAEGAKMQALAWFEKFL